MITFEITKKEFSWIIFELEKLYRGSLIFIMFMNWTTERKLKGSKHNYWTSDIMMPLPLSDYPYY